MTLSTSTITQSESPLHRGRMLEVDILRALCCLGVLGIHISGFYGDPQNGLRDFSYAHLLLFAFLNEGVRYALFGFMCISGLLLTVRHRGSFKAGSFLSKRVNTILVPYLTWVVLYLLVFLYHNPIAHEQIAKALHGSVPHIKILINWLMFGTWPHLYFINMLFQMYLLYAIFNRPITWILANRQRAMVLLILLVVLYPAWVLIRFLPGWYPHLHLPFIVAWMAKNPNRLAFEWMLPFAFGLVIGANYQEFLTWTKRLRPLLLVLTILALCCMAAIVAGPYFAVISKVSPTGILHMLMSHGVEWTRIWKKSSFLLPLLTLIYASGFTCLVLPAAARLMQRTGEKRPFWLLFAVKFSAASFGIYLLHPIFLYLLRQLHLPEGTLGISYALFRLSWPLYLVVVSLLVTGISYLIVNGMAELSKRWRVVSWLYQLLFGH